MFRPSGNSSSLHDKNAANATAVADNSPARAESSREQSTADAGKPAPSSLPLRVANGSTGATSLLDKERTLEQKYGSLYSADEEKERRKFRYHNKYACFKHESEMHRMRAEHLDTRNNIWNDSTEKNEAEIEKCKARIEEFEALNATMAAAAERMNEEFEADVEAWKEDQVAMVKYEAYFSLESDELDL